MASFSVRFLGCKVSHVDAHEVRERLLADGHVERDAGAEVAIVNTCCVTHEAVSKSRKEAARAARTHRRVYVTGCGANLAGNAFAGLPENVIVVATRSEATPDFVAGDLGALGCVQADARLDRVRAFVKVQDGCSFSCNFCVIPLVRGSSRSRRADAVLREIAHRVDQGHREVVLTGINLGCYRDRELGYDLPRLVRAAGATPGLERLRLSSIEINHVNEALIAALRETPTVSRHLHVPLQSGDDGVLRAMGRRYTASTYLRRLAPLQDEFNLTSDVIVGFPAEDERAFANTLRTARRRGLDEDPRLPVLAAARHGDRRRRSGPAAGEEGAEARGSAPRRTTRASHAGARRSTARTSCSSTGRAAATATTTRPGSSAATRRSAPSRACAARPSRRRGFSLPDDCLFCTLYRDGDHVAATEGFVAIRDINPQARDASARPTRAARRQLPRDRASFRPTRPSECSTSSPRLLRPKG